MSLKKTINNIIDDVEIDLTQEFDRNFERKAFFDQGWPDSMAVRNIGSQMERSGALRQSINSRRHGDAISWESALPYAVIQNEGGDIEVTAKMKKFFWAMYYKAGGAAKSGKGGKKRVEKMTSEAAGWKALALQKIGSVMTVKQRQFIGWHPLVDKSIESIADDNIREYNKRLTKTLKK